MLDTELTMKTLPILGLCATFAGVFAGPINQVADFEMQPRDQPFACNGFNATCMSTGVKQNGTSVILESTCLWPYHFPLMLNQLDLNKCIGSHDGVMHPGENGNFGKACHNMKYDTKTAILSADCGGPNGVNSSRVHLDTIIGNKGGGLCCYNFDAQYKQEVVW
ncbi:hypothetical protein O1611_g844 [Lasiodiplodia mahajangana]|uniref:Uncharacterized protein n=1 Tax=Lasiodiplodia mahajangana TaxID=1108764 RepID=A0ACC2JZR9_9PEZI|nr:hypothetical protein O1611_g844 [Lasiodiplodia mahajangana]